MMKKKRILFNELTQGIEEIKAHKLKKMTLRTHPVEKKSHPTVNAELIRKIREKFHMSRNLFAMKLRISPRTLEKWEQGQTIPNDQASILILMVRKFPDTLERLEKI